MKALFLKLMIALGQAADIQPLQIPESFRR
jgi:hypothetical protein